MNAIIGDIRPVVGEIVQFPCREDNFGYVVADLETGRAVAIDTPDAESVLALIGARGWMLTYILNTHWHEDHIGGNALLKEMTGARVIAPAIERARIPTTDIAIHHGAVILLGKLAIHAVETAGHTLGHLSYHVPRLNAVFTGDALFTLGCGRLFEGSPHMAWEGLRRLAALPGETRVFCAHEYGASNAAFAAACDAGPEVSARATAVLLLREQGLDSVPTTIGLERRTNPFLCLPFVEVEGDVAAQTERFAQLRARKDHF